jgi:hypothetical protein
MRIRIQLFTFMRIRILLFIKLLVIFDHWSVDPQRLRYFEPLKLLTFDFNVDPDPASKNKNADPIRNPE